MRNMMMIGYKQRQLTAAALAANSVKLMHLPLHGHVQGTDLYSGTGPVVTMVDRSPASKIGGSTVVVNPASGNWLTTPGRYTPAATSYASIKTAAAVELFDMQAAKVFICAFSLWHAGNPGTEANIIDAGQNNSAAGGGGGFGIRMQTTGNVNAVGRGAGTGSAFSGNATKAVGASTGVRIPIMFVVDCVNRSLMSYFGGTYWTASDWTGLADTMPKPPATWGVTIGARATSVSAFANYLGGGANSMAIADLWVINDASGILLSRTTQLAKELNESPSAIPRSLLRALGL